MLLHFRKTQCSREQRTRNELSCLLQRWSPIRRNVGGTWRVGDATRTSQGEKRSSLDWSESDDPATVALLQMEAEEEARLLQQDRELMSLSNELEHDEKTNWLRGCGWPRWFAQKPLHVIIATSRLAASPKGAIHLGTWNGVEWISSAATELKLRQLSKIVHLVLDRCEETLEQTPRVLRCWLRSWGSHFYAYPFELPQRDATRARYRSFLTRFLCYVFRSWRVCQKLNQSLSEVYGLQLSDAQVHTMESVWSDLIFKESGKPESATSSMSETVFQLLVLFWTDLSTDGILESKAIVHFSGVLGIHPYELAYRTAYDYTPYLAALLWIGRLLILEYALPLRAYTTLDVPWPARAAYADQGKRLCVEIRPTYLQRGSLSPMGYLIERLQHGRAIAKREGPRTNISWSLDGQTLDVAGSRISMHDFRHTIHCLLARLEKVTQDLMFDWWPKVDLNTLKEDLSKHRPGYSFLQEPVNQLQTSFKHLSRRAFSSEGKGFSLRGKGREKAMSYLKRCNDMVAVLFSSIHVTSGMPARGEELRVLRWADTAAVQRNIFICQGRILLVFAYNKASQNSNNSFFVVRVPCALVERCLFLYLAYIRPFSDFLSRQLNLVNASVPTNPHLFTAYDTPLSCFNSSACSKLLQQSTPECPILLRFQIYRQIAVAISKKHLPDIVQPFDPHTRRGHDGLLRLLSFQTGHNPATHAGAYALDRAYPAKLQPDLVEQYLEISKVWHQFLDIAKDSTLQVDLSSYAEHISLEAPVEPRMLTPSQADALFIDRTAQTRELPQASTVLQTETLAACENEQSRKRRRDSDESISPIQQKINTLRADLAALEQEHKMQKLCKAACQDSRDTDTTLFNRKRGSQVSLSNCAEVFCFLQDYRVFVCKQHHTAVINLDRHMSQYHNVPASVRRQVVNCFSRLKPVDPCKIKLPEEPAQAIEQLGKPLAGLQCRACGFITVNKDQIRMHCKRDHQLGWVGDTSQLYNSVRVQSFFRTGGMQKYFIVV
jgi:antitoxin component of RelBE/YafQ-DinJ toxin-antitoxin module